MYQNVPDYFKSSTNKEADKEAIRLIAQTIYSELSDEFMAIGYLGGTFKLQMRKGSCPYQAPPRRVAYKLQEPLNEELEQLQKQQIIVPLDVYETSELIHNFVLVPKANRKVQLSLDPARLNKVLIRLAHQGLTLNNILPRLACVKYLTLIDASLACHNLKLDEQSSYLTTFSCPFGRYRYI